MTVFKIYINGISDGNLVFRSDVSTALTGYGDTILSPKLKKETNKADSFEFMILPSHEKYGSFEKKKTFVFLTRDDKCIFRGRVSDVKTDIYKQRTISCEGDLAFLADSIQPPNKKNETSSVGSTKKKKNTAVYSIDGGRTYTVVNNKDTLKMTPETYFRTCIDVHNGQMTNGNKNFTVGSVTVTGKGTTEYFERTSYQDTSSVISSDLLSVYGGVLRTRYENGQAYIDWLDAYTETNSQEIRFGVNMIDLDQEPPTDEIWSVLLPTGEKNCTIESKNNGSKFLENSDAIDQYGYIVHHHAFSNVKKADELLTKARKYMSTHCKIFPNNLVIKAIDLQLIGESTDPLELGDKIKVVSSPHGLNKTMACIAMELDIYNPENNSYTIGTILPPDKEKKKEPLSEKHKNSHGSSSRGIANNANAISGLQNDVNVNANNINVNAENIAVNALNIAVNAENIAVVAKNIAIAADTIDIKAQQITATFGEETDDLYGHITASAEGIKTEFHDNTTGLSSYFTEEAGKITTAVENTKTGVYTKITQTETSITTEFNNRIYGENGLTTDYQRKITETAAGTIDEMYATLYGVDENGNPINPDDPNATPLGFYKRVRDEAVDHSVDSFHTELYGEGGTSTNPKSGSVFDAVYTKTSTYSRDYFKAQLYGNGSVENPDGGTVLYGVYNKSASSWKNELWGENGSKDNPKEGSILYGTRQEIGAKVSKGDVEAGFTITSDGVKLFGKEVSLGKYATVTNLTATNTKVSNLITGVERATLIDATKLYAYSEFQIGSAQNTAKFFVNGTQYAGGRRISFLGQDRYVLSRLNDWGDSVQWNLNHSHSCTTNSNGTITLGGAVTLADAGSFKIADTKTYKDGVSAATNSVTITSLNKDPDASVEYDSDRNKYTVPLKAVASNLNSKTANYTFFATAAYNAGNTDGVNSVTITSLNKDPSASVSYDTANNKYTIPLKAVASNSNSKTANYTFFATDAYNTGYADGAPNDSTWSIPNWSDRYNYQLVAVPDDSDGVRDCATFKVQFNDNRGETHTHTFAKIPCWDVYNNGVNSVTITSLNKDPDASVTYDSDNNKYTIPLKAVASNSNSKTANYTFFATDAYNGGYDAGYSDGKPNSTTWSIPNWSSTEDWQMVAVADNGDGVKDSVKFKVTFNDNKGTARSHIFNKIPCWDVYNSGRDSVTITSLNKDPDASVSYNASSMKYTVPLKAVASNGNSKTENYSFYATAAYNAAFVDGENYVANSISCNTVRVYADGTAKVWVHYNYEGSDKTKTIDIPASGVTDLHS